MSEARPLSGRTLLTAVLGDPVEHSLSPAMHNAAYAALGLERAYIAFHVTPERLRDVLRAIPALGLLGVNLTVPHKERALRLMTHLSDEARTLGAINCVVNRAGALYGDNTDARGLELDLRLLGVTLADRVAIVIGAGGAAAAAVLACIRLGARRIVVCNRTVARANRLARRFAGYIAGRGGGRPREIIEARGLDALLKPALLADAGLVVNATPMGLKTGGFAPLAYDASPATTVFYDMVYAREPTPFIHPARALGRPAHDGAGMLLGQGELAFELFNGVKPPPGVMRAALYSALSRPLPTPSF
jgi:shikimate dehydrogenase